MHSDKNIEKEVLGIVERILNKGPIALNQTFDELEVDSILFIRLVVQCETNFSIHFEDEMLLISKFQDVDAFARYIRQRCDLVI